MTSMTTGFYTRRQSTSAVYCIPYMVYCIPYMVYCIPYMVYWMSLYPAAALIRLPKHVAHAPVLVLNCNDEFENDGVNRDRLLKQVCVLMCCVFCPLDMLGIEHKHVSSRVQLLFLQKGSIIIIITKQGVWSSQY